ncbi:hypothetical protein P12x_005272 [Tundrisphaera lichenicola]|uniref:hypothetical protein n=1 Tax=Tundrisphaera lichenicola TaxID=2029860 RepID=UPI003EB77914
MDESTKQQLALLTDAWKIEKQNESDANARRIAIESQIYELTQSELPDKGTYTLPTGMKIATGFSEEWSQEQLNAAYQEWNASVPFPFTGTWKPDGKAISYLRENLPEAYKKIQPALTLKPKKPAFSVKE